MTEVPEAIHDGMVMDIPKNMRAWALNGPGELELVTKPVNLPSKLEVLVQIDAVAICDTDLEIIHHGLPAVIEGGLPFNKGFTPGLEYMGTVAALGPGVDEFKVGDRVAVETHSGCGQCKRCRNGMYASCHNYGKNFGQTDKCHRANGFTTDGGFGEYAINNINTLVPVPNAMSDEEATLIATAGAAACGLTELGGVVAGECVAVTGPGPVGLMGVAVAKALGAQPVILAGKGPNRLRMGQELGADHVVNLRAQNPVERVRELTGGVGADCVLECSGTASAVNDAVYMCNRGGRICFAAFQDSHVPVDIKHVVTNSIQLHGTRGEGRNAMHRAAAMMEQRKFDASKIHTHTFMMADLPEALRYAREPMDDAIKVVVKNEQPVPIRGELWSQ